MPLAAQANLNGAHVVGAALSKEAQAVKRRLVDDPKNRVEIVLKRAGFPRKWVIHGFGAGYFSYALAD